MADILTTIIEQKKQEVAQLKKIGYEQANLYREGKHKLADSLLSSKELRVIAEIKRASPSKGEIASAAEPAQQAKRYEDGGAAAVSVLTDQRFFKGSIEDLKAVRREVDLPLLCKDFFIDEIQIDRAKDAGANIILLIVAALTQKRLEELYRYAVSLDLEVLVEIHDEDEGERAAALGAAIIGINNRNLKTFQVDLANTERLAPLMNGKNSVVISESGIKSREDAIRAARAGAEGILAGESLMISRDAGKAIRSFSVCKEDALLG
ncbi:indole-3-glycerol phosphate synthase TrpC [Bacillus salacetis]|uniref:Indole-3-glycerol phosphate synthase n=1 Tax=Bacillus salacetis TaxID=2315464 RepID=A0A3A1R048_9BACI|nr:indole-3-glycerol phosphate synthase TrpC [Bacillus salacetis]RIW35060.1 indole-3-glycerol phosphate synthase TrpC [Bacillus salacetis]